jgi:hypothetical protein
MKLRALYLFTMIAVAVAVISSLPEDQRDLPAET